MAVIIIYTKYKNLSRSVSRASGSTMSMVQIIDNLIEQSDNKINTLIKQSDNNIAGYSISEFQIS